MASKSGGAPIKNIRKVKPGYDQPFTLPKGTSAAPVKQVASKGSKFNRSQQKSKSGMSDAEKVGLGITTGVVAEKKFGIVDKIKKGIKSGKVKKGIKKTTTRHPKIISDLRNPGGGSKRPSGLYTRPTHRGKK
jgi:hypothetical protein